jgi:hypothetical protein
LFKKNKRRKWGRKIKIKIAVDMSFVMPQPLYDVAPLADDVIFLGGFCFSSFCRIVLKGMQTAAQPILPQ